MGHYEKQGEQLKENRKPLYNLKHIGQVGLHYAASIGLTAAAFAIGENWTIAAGAAVTTVITHISTRAHLKYIENNLQKYGVSHQYSPNLQVLVNKLYRVSGLKADNNPLYKFKPAENNNPEANRYNQKSSKDGLKEQFTNMAQIPNAIAMNMSKPVIMISEPLLKLLNEEEEYAVLAHEFVHAKALHTKAIKPPSLSTSLSNISNILVQLSAFISSGVAAIISALIGGGLAMRAFKKLHPNGHLVEKLEQEQAIERKYGILFPNPHNLSLEEKIAAKKLQKASANVGKAVLTTITTVFNPSYLPIVAAVNGLTISSKLTNSSLSRRFEFQADQGAVKLEANPLALITALKKMEKVYDQSIVQEYGYDPRKQENKLSTFWKELNASHPNTNRRVKRLTKMARKMGYSEEKIYSAANDDVDISGYGTIPKEIIKAMVL